MKKALLFHGGWEGHEPETTSALIAEGLKGSGFSVELSPTLDVLLDEARLREFDLIVPNWTCGQLNAAQEGSLIRTVAGGVGLGGFHGGMGDAFRNNTKYQFMVGGQFVAHPDGAKDYVVHITNRADPIVAGLEDFTVHSEQYYMHVDPSNEVIATTTFQSASAPWINGTVMPVAWKRRYGTGRVFYFSVGHGATEFDTHPVRELTLRGVLWAAR